MLRFLFCANCWLEFFLEAALLITLHWYTDNYMNRPTTGAGGNPALKKKSKRNKSGRKRKKSGWNVFLSSLRKKASSIPFDEFSAYASNEWKALTDDKRKEFEKRADMLNQREMEKGKDKLAHQVKEAPNSMQVPRAEGNKNSKAEDEAPSSYTATHHGTQESTNETIQEKAVAEERSVEQEDEIVQSNQVPLPQAPPPQVRIKQEEFDDDDVVVIERSPISFEVFIDNFTTDTVVRLDRNQNLTFQDLRTEIEADMELPFDDFRFSLPGSGRRCVNRKQEKKWFINDREFGLMHQGDGSLENPYCVYIQEAK